MKGLETFAKIMKPLQIKVVLPKVQYIALGAEYRVTNTASHCSERFVRRVILVVSTRGFSFFVVIHHGTREHSCFLVRVLLSARTSRIFKFINKKMLLRNTGTVALSLLQ